MYLKSKLLYIQTETPLHAGSGAGLGVIDLPIQRERMTGYPIIQSGGVKGALRDAAGDDAGVNLAFGSDSSDFAGALSVGDANILLYPVRSLKGVFAWTTCVYALQRWQRELVAAGLEDIPVIPDSPAGSENAMYCYAIPPHIGNNNDGVVLEEYTFKCAAHPMTGGSDVVAKLAAYLAEHVIGSGPYWGNLLKQNLVILDDSAFGILVQNTTEVSTRIRINDTTKTVEKGALWVEETLPVDSVLYAPIRASKFRHSRDEKIPEDWKNISDPREQAAKVLGWAEKTIGNKKCQFGGDETVGHGIVNLRWS